MKKQNQSIKIFSLPFISGVEALSGNDICNEFRRHIHKTYIVGFIEKGKRIITYKDGASQILKKEIFILNPSQVHSCRSEGQSGHSYKILSVSPQTMLSIASQISEKQEKQPYFRNIHNKDKALSEKMIGLFEVIEDPESDIQVESILNSFLTYLIMYFSETPPQIYLAGEQNESIKRVCDFISYNFAANLSLKKMSEIACLSQFHFQREFKRIMQITPHEYLSDFKIREAKKMLSNSEDVADIAYQLGFYDQSHFSRIFRKTVGIPPGKYSKINRM